MLYNNFSYNIIIFNILYSHVMKMIIEVYCIAKNDKQISSILNLK